MIKMVVRRVLSVTVAILLLSTCHWFSTDLNNESILKSTDLIVQNKETNVVGEKQVCCRLNYGNNISRHYSSCRLPGRSKIAKFCFTKHGYLTYCIQLSNSTLMLSCGDLESNPGPREPNDSRKTRGKSKSTATINSLKCGLLNTRSVRNKLADVQLLMTSNDLDVFAVTESWLTSDISDAELLAGLPYSCYRNDRADGRKGGGVLVAVKNSCIASRRCDLERKNLEMVVTEIQSANSSNLIVAVFYRPPDSSPNFFDEFEAFLHSVDTLNSNKKLVILGDFNLPKIDWPNLSASSLTGHEFDFCETLKDFYLTQMVLSPTRITDDTQSILDLVITNHPESTHCGFIRYAIFV